MCWQNPFPRSSDRGLIEATIDNLLTLINGIFPRSSDRGLIEAIEDLTHDEWVAHFRDHLIAASLKLHLVRLLFRRPLAAFPRSSDRGLIEALGLVE